MTKTSPPPVNIEWEPIPEGIVLLVEDDEYSRKLPLQSVRELRDDMEEASMLSRGLAPKDVFVEEINKDDWLVLMGDSYKVTSTLEGYYGWVVEFGLNSYSDVRSEIILPPDLQVTVWRTIT